MKGVIIGYYHAFVSEFEKGAIFMADELEVWPGFWIMLCAHWVNYVLQSIIDPVGAKLQFDDV